MVNFMYLQRPGWVERPIKLRMLPQDRIFPVNCYDVLGVHVMDREDRWTISHVPSGIQMLCGGRIFRTQIAAMNLVENIYDMTPDWGLYFTKPKGDVFFKPWMEIHDQFEQWGAFHPSPERNKGLRPPQNSS